MQGNIGSAELRQIQSEIAGGVSETRIAVEWGPTYKFRENDEIAVVSSFKMAAVRPYLTTYPKTFPLGETGRFPKH